MPIDLPPEPLCLLWREGYVLGSSEDCGGIERVRSGIWFGPLLLVAGDGPFPFDIARGHDRGGRRADGVGLRGLRSI